MNSIKKFREKHKLTQEQLADQIGTTQQTVARWESGKAEPSLAMLRDLSLALWTSVDALLGRQGVLDTQSTNPFSWIHGDDSGYWGNIGIRLPGEKFSFWYPITTAQKNSIFQQLSLANSNTWITFQSLNNRMVAFNPPKTSFVTFLDEAEDQINGDWEVGPADVEGWPEEVYEVLEHLYWEMLGVGSSGESGQFSPKLTATGLEVIEANGLTECDLRRMLISTVLHHTDGRKQILHVSDEFLGNTLTFFDFLEDEAMIHLDDEDGNHSVFVSRDLVRLIEMPLIAFKRGLATT